MPEEPNDPNAGGGAGTDLTPDDPKVKPLIEQAVKEATSGLAANKDEILKEKKDLQTKLDEVSKQWEGLDPEAVRNIMQRMENDEETKLLAEGKTDEVIERRTSKLKTDYEKRLEQAQGQIQERDQKLEQAQTQVKQLKVEGSLRQAASELGLVPSAVEDALTRAMGVFTIDNKGNLVAQDEDGSTVYGKDGKNPMTPAEWLADMKEKAPHWFPAPSGGGAGGGNGRGGSHSITREQARDVQTYRKAKEAADKAGVNLQIVG